MSSFANDIDINNVMDCTYYCSLAKALRLHLPRRKPASGLFILITPEGINPSDYSHAAERYAAGRNRQGPDDTFRYICLSEARKKPFAEQALSALSEADLGLIFTASLDYVADRYKLSADAVIPLPPLTTADLKAGARLAINAKLTAHEASELFEFPLSHVAAALKAGRTVQQALDRLRAISAVAATRSTSFENLPLDEMTGYGEAREWGLQLARDMRDWRNGALGWTDVDKGLLLSGPPGCGKTIYAASLAKTCNVNLIATSAAQWQAKGHLGDLLKAMRADFATAISKAPSILFIDEIDSIGDRRQFSSDNRDYSVQVVNGLLERLDGFEGREGVVVIGATNFPANLDAALTRPGRLDRHIIIPLPDAASRQAILTQHLGANVSPCDIVNFTGRTEGMTGADLAQVARDAKRRARLAKRPLNLDDVELCLPATRTVDGAFRKSAAYHEAGHALVGRRVNFGRLLDVTVTSYVIGSQSLQQIGAARFEADNTLFRDRPFYLNKICTLLAGMAAEQLVLGTFGDGAASGDESDLARATLIATLMEASFGMGEQLAKTYAVSAREWAQIRRGDVSLSNRVNEILKNQLSRATAILQDNMWLLHQIAGQLEKLGFISGTEIEVLDETASNPPLRKRQRRPS